MKTKLLTLIILTLCMIGFYSCSDNDDQVKTTNVTLTLKEPAGLENPVMTAWDITLTEKNTGYEYKTGGNNKTFTLTIPEGDYKILAEGKVTYELDGKNVEGLVRVSSESNVAIGEAITFFVTPYLYIDYDEKKAGFLIQEIFYTGTLTPEGKQYSGDKYIKLYNNTDKKLYADGLFIACTMKTSSINYTYTPEVIDQAVAVNGIIVIPGDGTKYPVEPGKSFLLVQSAVNHKLGNKNSVDLTKADMEWTNPDLLNQPADNPDVPNATNLYSNFQLHNRGLTSIIIGRLEETQEKYLANYVYEYTWKWVFNDQEYNRGPFEEYKIPNSWVMDGVFTSVEGQDLRTVFSPTIDMGWTYCGAFDRDNNRYGKSVRRKVLNTAPDGRQVLKDTNNSAVDFTPNSKPSLAE